MDSYFSYVLLAGMHLIFLKETSGGLPTDHLDSDVSSEDAQVIFDPHTLEQSRLKKMDSFSRTTDDLDTILLCVIVFS